jgi:hypothetical protein
MTARMISSSTSGIQNEMQSILKPSANYGDDGVPFLSLCRMIAMTGLEHVVHMHRDMHRFDAFSEVATRGLLVLATRFGILFDF